jgi:protein subunit release factor A
MSNLVIQEDDLAVQSYPHRCAGGQQVNSIKPGVSVFHVPSGLGVICDTERSQTKNKNKALQLLMELISRASCLNQPEG